MNELGLQLIRMGEFSWSHVEPSPGQCRPQLFLQTLDEAFARQISVIFCTPTATPPKWLSDLYPEILLVDRNGYRVPFGGRRHYDPWSGRYIEESLRIAGIYGDLFGAHPAVVGWQIDNEFGHHTSSRSFSEASEAAFRLWLKERYEGDIEKLNKSHFGGFWSMNYRDFSEVSVPRTTLNPPNPHLEMDFYRFMTKGYFEFQKNQIDVIRKKSPQCWITHNYIPMFDELCLWTMSRQLDMVGYDHYQTLEHPNPVGSACQFALMRSLKQNKQFMILEQQPLQVNWQTLNRRFSPDWLFLWGLQAAFSGASAQLYFSWQRFYGGSEQYHEGIRSHDIRVKTTPTESMIAAQQQFFAEMAAEFPGAEPFHFPVRVVVVYDFESIWAHQVLPQTHLWQFQKLIESWLQPLFGLGIGVLMVPHLQAARDFMESKNPFGQQYFQEVQSLLIPAYAFEWTDQERSFLREFVESGGRVVSMPRTAMKTNNNGMSRRPHCFVGDEDFCFVDHGPLGEEEHEEVVIGDSQVRIKARIWAEKIAILNKTSWKTLAVFTSGVYAESPAIIQYQPFSEEVAKGLDGGGAMTHFAFVPEESSQTAQVILEALGFAVSLTELAPSRDFLQFNWQSRSGQRYFGMVNFGYSSQEIETSFKTLAIQRTDESRVPPVSGIVASISRQDQLKSFLFKDLEHSAEGLPYHPLGYGCRWNVPARSVIVWRPS